MNIVYYSVMGLGLLDQYSLLHLASGVVVYFWGVKLRTWFIIHGLFELLENTEVGMRFINETLGGVWPGGKSYADNWVNMVSDQVFSILGWFMAYYVDSYYRIG